MATTEDYKGITVLSNPTGDGGTLINDALKALADRSSASINVTEFGAVCDGTTDDTVAVQAAIDSLLGASGEGVGGTLVFPAGTCRCDSAIILRDSGGSTPRMPYLRLTGAGAGGNIHTNGNGGDDHSASILDLRADRTLTSGQKCKLFGRGMGVLEIDNLELADLGASGTGAFIYITNTTVKIHEMAFTGRGEGTTCVNDGVIFGGQTWNAALNTDDAAFRGYGSYVRNNLFNRVRRCGVWHCGANGIQWRDNTISVNCGSATAGDAALMLVPASGEAARGNIIEGDLIESPTYPYGIRIDDRATENFIKVQLWDGSGATAGVYNGGLNNDIQVTMDSSFSGKGFSGINSYNRTLALNAGYENNWDPADRPITVTDASTIAWYSHFRRSVVTLGGNRTLGLPGNMVAGRRWELWVYQDGSGSRTLSYHSNIKLPNDVAPTLATRGGSLDILFFESDGTYAYLVDSKSFPATRQAAILGSSPTNYWPMQETSGTTLTDLGSGAKNLTLSGTYTLNQTGPNGRQCISFNGGIAQTLTSIGSELSSKNKMTIVGWINLASSSDNFNLGFDGTLTERCEIQCSGGTGYMVMEAGFTNYPNIVPQTGWKQWAIVYDGTQTGINRTRFYWDGVLQTLTSGGSGAGTSFNGTNSDHEPFVVGNNVAGGGGVGKVCDVIVYAGIAKTAADLLALI